MLFEEHFVLKRRGCAPGIILFVDMQKVWPYVQFSG